MKLVIIDDDLQFATAMKNDLLIHFCKYDEDVEIDIIDDNYFNLINANQYLFYILGLMNSKVLIKLAQIFSQGLSIGSGHIANVPFVYMEHILD